MEKNYTVDVCPLDTDPKIFEHQKNMIMQKTGAERMRMAFSMLAFAKHIIKSSIKQKFPDISDNQMKIEVFKRFYSRDFTPEQMEKIISKLWK